MAWYNKSRKNGKNHSNLIYNQKCCSVVHRAHGKKIVKNEREHCIKLVRKMCIQIFRQITQKFRRQTVWSQSILVRHAFVLEQNPASNAVVWQGISEQYDGKSARRLRAKPSGGLYAVFPERKCRGEGRFRLR